MGGEKEKLSTEELMRMLETSDTLDNVIYDNQSISNPDTSSYLSGLLIKYGITIQQVLEKAVISRSFGYQIFNGLRNPNRDILLRIAIVMKLNVDEVQRLLKISRRGELYPKIRRDAAIIFCIKNKCDLTDTVELLESIGELSLF